MRNKIKQTPTCSSAESLNFGSTLAAFRMPYLQNKHLQNGDKKTDDPRRISLKPVIL